MFYWNSQLLILGFVILKIFCHIYHLSCTCSFHFFKNAKLMWVLSVHDPHLTCTDFWIPAGKGALLCLIHHLAHYCTNGLISTALLTTFSCLSLPAATNEMVLLPWPPQTHNIVSCFKWKTLEFLYVPWWYSTPHNMKWDQVSSCCFVHVNIRYFFLSVCVSNDLNQK